MDSPVESRIKDIRDSLSHEEIQCLAARLLTETEEAKDDTCPVSVEIEDSKAKPVIEFFVEHQHRSLLELAPPAPAGKFYPQWMRSMDSYYHNVTQFQAYPPDLKTRQNATIKMCPGINDYLRTGYVIPLWCDFAITFRKDGSFQWQSPNDEFQIQSHPREQYDKMPNAGFPTELKFVSPWYCRTSPGYSMRALPCYYHFDHLWSVLPGVVHSDQNHTTHINTLFEVEEGQIILPRGTPMMHIVPFRREKYELDIHVASKEDVDLIDRYRAEGLRFISGNDGYKTVPGHFS
ncbi:MAG: hypothetical protein CMO55_06810 [Verrucomicrobiales bacterium]|nr:hypothetical protein [Verrucomicrobiales bacterium]